MASIKAQLAVGDGMTGPLRHISAALSSVLDGFEQMQRASGRAINAATIQQGRAALVGCNLELDGIEKNANAATAGQSRFNDRLREGTSIADRLGGKIGAMVASLGAGAAVAKTVQLSDQIAGNRARLSLMVDDGGSVAALEQKIFASAQNSRGAYMDTMATVSKMGILAGDAFSGNDEIIKFTELLNKNFVISGASASEQQNSMYQLTQAMASGRLQGDEFRSIRENAPLLAQSIEAYMTASGVPGTMKDWAKDGMITSEVIKAALFSTADDVNARFEQMPMTWGQVWTNMQNRAIVAMDPVLAKINALANSQDVQTMINGLINGFAGLMVVVLGAVEIMGAVAGFFYDNWSILSPLIWGVVAALIAYGVYMAITNGLEIIGNIQKGIAAVMAYAKAEATDKDARATALATAAQFGFNAALLACPLTWIIVAIIAIIAIIYAVVAAINHFTGSSISATGIIFGALSWLGSVIANIFMGLLELIFGVINALIDPFINIANFIGNVFTSPISSIIYLFQGMADGVLGVLQTIASALDFVFGSNMAGAVAGWRTGLKGMADAAVAEYAPNENYKSVMDKLDLSVENTLGRSRFDNTDAFGAGDQFGREIESKVGGMFKFDDTAGIPDISGLGQSSADTAANTGATADALTATTEDLKYLRDLAEQEVVNRFTTAEVKIDMTGMSNRIDSNMDIDGVVSRLAEGFTEAVQVSAEGVHA